MIKMGSFRSYVDLEEYEMKIPTPVNGSFLQPKFIPGELVIAEATNVLRFTSLSKTKGLSGSLFVTNARVVFVSSDHVCSEDSFPLLSINTLWYYESSSKNTSSSSGVKKTRRKVKLGPMRSSSTSSSGSSINASSFQSQLQSIQQSASNSFSNNLIPSSASTRIHEIFIVCSNFRTLRISFKFSPIDQGLRVCNAVIHHAFPEQLDRLFYFDFCRAYTAQWTSAQCNPPNSPGGLGLGSSRVHIPTYMDKGDWLRELNLARTTTGGYRISKINEGFDLCGSLPEWIVVPSDVNDSRVRQLSEKLKGSRPPHWTWGDSRGAAIVIMGKLNNELDSSAENTFFESLRKGHPKGLAPTIYDLDAVVGVKEIRQSFIALVDLCCPESLSQYQDMDGKFYSSLEHTKWLQLVSRVLAKCNEIMEGLMQDGNVIVFQEQEGRDASCLFSSLIQLIADPRFRTITGFFSLIQKDWVAFGHPFHSTYLHTSPFFLLFLDCVFQLQNQNPFGFEFNERLLSSLWDSSFDCTTGTFLFDCPQQRKTMELCKDSTAWISIFSSASACIPPSSPSDVASSPSARRDQILAKSITPKSLLNPLFQMKSLLANPTPIMRQLASQIGSSPIHNPSSHPMMSNVNTSICLANTQLLASVNSVMCDLTFWDTLYLHRTLETTPMIVTTSVGEIPSVSAASSPAHSASSASPSPSPSSKFYFPIPPSSSSSTESRRPGRDTLAELKIVEELLANLTATRFQKNSSSSSSSNLYQSRGGLSSSSSSSSSGAYRGRTAGPPSQPQPHSSQYQSGSPISSSSSVINSSSRSRHGNNHHHTSSNPNPPPPAPPRRNPFLNLTSTS